MDRGACQVAVYGVSKESDMTVIKQQQKTNNYMFNIVTITN